MFKKKEEILLGQKVKCVVTNFEGVVTSISQYIHGTRRIGIQPPVGEDGKIPEGQDIDEPQLVITNLKQVIKVKMPKPMILIGQEVVDPVTGFTGIAIGRCDFINGCSRVGVQKKYNEAIDKEFHTGTWFHEPQLKIVEKVIAKDIAPTAASRKTGGPSMMKSYKNERVK